MRFRVQGREKKRREREQNRRGLGFREEKREETRKREFTFLTIYFYVFF
jgi:hypothetical protein